ncbi:hypothetical protein B0H11DRAFT_2225464 [Mycena galericulata]|nr:hypothetical protein B0H11DRAFT_2225464 [Mycena galericulata]
MEAVPPSGPSISNYVIRDSDGCFLDPYHHLRRPEFEVIIPYLLDQSKMSAMDSDAAYFIFHRIMSPLSSHATEWEGRDMPQEVKDFLYPLRLFFKKFDRGTTQRLKRIIPPGREPVLPWYRLGVDFQLPPATNFYKRRAKKKLSAPLPPALQSAAAPSTSTPATSTKKPKSSTTITPVSGKTGAATASSPAVVGSSSVSAHPTRAHSFGASTSTPVQSKPSKPKPKPRPPISPPADVASFQEPPDETPQRSTIVAKRPTADVKHTSSSTLAPSVPVKRKYDGIDISEDGPSNDGPRARRERTAPGREPSQDKDESPEPKKRARKGRGKSPKGRKVRGPLRPNAPPAKNYTVNLKDIPEDARYLFDERAVTAYLPCRFNHERGKPNKKVGKPAPDFEPWYPRVKTVTYYDGIAPTEVISTTKSVPEQNRYGPLPPIPRKNIDDVMLRVLEDPGFSCIECILFNSWCEFRGYGVQCTACENQNRKGCSFRGSTVDLDRIFIQMAPWFDTSHRHVIYMVSELHAAHVRAHNATVEAVHAVKEFESRWVDFASQSTRIINLIGADHFTERFTEENSSPAMLEAINDRVQQFNDLQKEFDDRMAEDHVKAFDPSIEAHSGQHASGSSEGLEEQLPRAQLQIATLVDDPSREQYSPPPEPVSSQPASPKGLIDIDESDGLDTSMGDGEPTLSKDKGKARATANDDLEALNYDESDLEDGDDVPETVGGDGNNGPNDESDLDDDTTEEGDAASYNPDQSDLDDGDDKEYNAQKGVVEG